MDAIEQRPHVGFYVHYHGMGHKQRTAAILDHLRSEASVIASRRQAMKWDLPASIEFLELACDNDSLSQAGLQHANDVPGLHFAPLWSDNVTDRVARYTDWLNRTKPDVMVVDVSVEISMLTRLASIPQIVMRQHGLRDDPAHTNAYAAAQSLLAPFPEMMEDEMTPRWVRDKTVYVDGFHKRDLFTIERPESNEARQATIAFLFGHGGPQDVHRHLSDAASSLPHCQCVVIGKDAPGEPAERASNLHYLGWVNDVTKHVVAADVVVTAAGHNSVMELGQLGSKFIAIAEPRPFAEQLRKVAVLNREQLAIGLDDWPMPHQWPTLIQQARKLDPSRWKAIFLQDGAIQAAEHIDQVASWSHHQRRQPARISL
ncbi:glycosyltransferase [Neorhodopirellula pilleata]|uniref:MurG-like transferase n=1 Tax=Neorhodopirellula pilleata TaxID=2714738 RepID=A0A5C6A1A6_9BACT|nr:glycosyltransferase [Neorhodopirellula pilleata]TWT93612.1 MurG-like transferase [Neorhodopirellula pilleata]